MGNTSLLKLIGNFVLCMITHLGYAQRGGVINNACPNPTGGNFANFTVDWFLLSPVAKTERAEAGAINETAEEKSPVSDETICGKLDQIVRNNPKYKNIEDNLPPDRTRYHYSTENFYYVFWDKKPEFEIPGTGPRELFIVVSKDFENIWEFYL
jgi:hypothetical protein